MNRVIGPHRGPGGRPADELRYRIIERFGLKCGVRKLSRFLPIALAEQVERCQCDEARRLLLGVSEQQETTE
jgi:hypothetical protein